MLCGGFADPRLAAYSQLSIVLRILRILRRYELLFHKLYVYGEFTNVLIRQDELLQLFCL
jgi:hypothetical protein